MDPENDNGLTEEAAEAAMLESLMGEGEGGEQDTDEGEDEGGEYDEYEPNPEDADDDEEGSDETDEEEGEGGEEAETAGTTEALNDDAEIALSIDGTEQKVKLGDLKALYGEREAVTRKNKEVDLVGARASAALQTAIEVLAEDLQPYQNVDWLVLQQQLDPETFAWHRANAQALEAKYDKLAGAVQGVEQTFSQRRQNVDREAATSALKELQTDIPDWSDATYSEILKYGAAQGLDPQDLASVTNPKVIKLIRKAMLHDRAAKVATKKVQTAPAKVIKGAKASNAAAPKQINAKKAMQRLQTTGSDDAAMAALMARMG